MISPRITQQKIPTCLSFWWKISKGSGVVVRGRGTSLTLKGIHLGREHNFRKISVHSATLISWDGHLSLNLVQQECQVPEIYLVYPGMSQFSFHQNKRMERTSALVIHRMCYHSYLYLAHISERAPGSGANMTSCCRPCISMYIKSKPESPLSQPRCVNWLPSVIKLHEVIEGEIKLTSTIDDHW